MERTQQSRSGYRFLSLWALALALVIIWGEVRYTEAGCQRFGHSCFGAHGKRAEVPSQPQPEGDLPLNIPDYYQVGPNGRVVSPYLLDWLMSVHRQPPLPLYRQGQDDQALGERRK